MNKAFPNFQWENSPSTNTPLNQTNLNKINNGLNEVDNRVIALNDALSTEVETIGEAAIYAHEENSFFYAVDMKVYKAITDIAIGDTLTLNTNCVRSNVIDNLGGAGGSSGHIIVDEGGTEYTQRSKLKFENATVTDDPTNDTTVVTAEGGSSSILTMSEVLTAGNTTVTFYNIPSDHYLVDFYTNTGVPYTAIDTSTPGQATLTFEVQSTDITVICNIEDSANVTVTTQTLAAGSTSVTFTGLPTTGDYLIDFYTSTGIEHTDMDISIAGQATLTFDAQSSNIVVFCKIKEVEL